MAAKRCTACAARSPYGMGCRMTTGFRPCRRNCAATRRETGLLPHPVRPGHTEITGTRRLELRAPGSQKPKVGIRRYRTGGEMHQVLVGNVAVGKRHRINLVLGDQILQIFLFENRNAFWIQGSCKLRRIAAAGNIWNLYGGECNYLVGGIITK